MVKRIQDIAAELDEEVKVYPAWTPQEGEKLIGGVIRKDKVAGNDLIVVRAFENNECLTVWNSATLKDLFETVKVGDTVGLKYLGEAESRSGRTYKNIRYVLKPAP